VPPLPSSFRPDKLRLAQTLARTPWSSVVGAAERGLGLNRVIVTHGTPERFRATYAAQLDRLLERFEPLDPHRLEESLRPGAGTGTGTGARRRAPWVAFTFDDALLGNYEVAAEELERRGARGIFSVPVDFPAVPRAEQPAWFRAHVREEPDAEHATDEDMLAMSWEQVRDLVARGHRLACHTASHLRIDATTPPEALAREIAESRGRLEELAGTTVDGFCWPVVYDPRATEAIAVARATYSWTLITDTSPVRAGHDPLAIHRTRIEASWPVEAVDFQVSGAVDAAFVAYGLRDALRARRG
jgi:peptidoglycan/xylan/chitin deacetylase (PgdA/CDA1 family)